MRKTLLLGFLAAATGACAYTPPPAHLQDPAYYDALEVRLLPPQDGFLRFVTSERAHVAVFEIAPDRGVSMLYPQLRVESARVSRVGTNVEFLPWRAQGRWFYASTPFYPSFAELGRPTYLYIIASKSPLQVEDIRLRPARLRSAMGWRSFLASDLSGTLDDLERLVVPEIAGDDWSSDLYIIWPEAPLRQPWQTRYVFMNCPDGRTVVVPLGWNINACPGARNLAQATKPAAPQAPNSPPGAVPETDSTGIPLRRPPDATDTKPRQPVAPPAVASMPSDWKTGSRAGFESAAPSRRAPARAADAPPRRRAEAPRPTAAPPVPRKEPASTPAPQRNEPKPAPAEPREPVTPKQPAQP